MHFIAQVSSLSLVCGEPYCNRPPLPEPPSRVYSSVVADSTTPPSPPTPFHFFRGKPSKFWSRQTNLVISS